MAATVLAVDLGASSGRVIPIDVDHTSITIGTSARFPNGPVERDGLRWDVPALAARVRAAIAQQLRHGVPAQSVGIDTWGVDYAWVRPDGDLVDLPYCYRDPRTTGLEANIDQERAFAITGVPGHVINTSTQLLADRVAGRGISPHDRLLFLPDLLNLWLSGRARTEPTIASTSQLLDLTSGEWSAELLGASGVALSQLPEIGGHGLVGPVRDRELRTLAPRLRVQSVASHDTASAIAATPLQAGDAYVSLGTWACVGVELAAPLLTPEARRSGFTNECGVDGTVGFHRSAMGLWLIQQCLLEWPQWDAETAFGAAAEQPSGAVIDPDDPSLFTPGAMAGRIRDLCRATDQPPPGTPAAMTRCIADSLATALAGHARTAAAIARAPLRRIRVVGGGSRAALVCQLLADAAGVTVLAGPAEATAIGNALMQARELGGPRDLDRMRELVSRSIPATRYEPKEQP